MKTVNKPNTKPKSSDRAELAELIFAGMRNGLSAHQACKQIGLPQSTFNHWLNDDIKMAAEYARAREDLIEHIAAETLRIADSPVGSTDSGATDSGAVQKQRLQVDTRKWLLSKLAPKKWGEKLELSGDPDSPLLQKIERVIVKNG